MHKNIRKKRLLFRLLIVIGLVVFIAPFLFASDDDDDEEMPLDKPYAGQSIRILHDKRPNTENLLDLVPEFEADRAILSQLWLGGNDPPHNGVHVLLIP